MHAIVTSRVSSGQPAYFIQVNWCGPGVGEFNACQRRRLALRFSLPQKPPLPAGSLVTATLPHANSSSAVTVVSSCSWASPRCRFNSRPSSRAVKASEVPVSRPAPAWPARSPSARFFPSPSRSSNAPPPELGRQLQRSLAAGKLHHGRIASPRRGISTSMSTDSYPGSITCRW